MIGKLCWKKMGVHFSDFHFSHSPHFKTRCGSQAHQQPTDHTLSSRCAAHGESINN
jgi:hypothetical protein